MDLAKKYNVSWQQVHRIILKFAAENDKSALLMKNKPKDNQAEELKALQEEVLSLKKQLHGWSRAKKEALISGDIETLKQLSKKKDLS